MTVLPVFCLGTRRQHSNSMLNCSHSISYCDNVIQQPKLNHSREDKSFSQRRAPDAITANVLLGFSITFVFLVDFFSKGNFLKNSLLGRAQLASCHSVFPFNSLLWYQGNLTIKASSQSPQSNNSFPNKSKYQYFGSFSSVSMHVLRMIFFFPVPILQFRSLKILKLPFSFSILQP